MKMFIALMFLVMPVSAMASNGALHFSDGPLAGEIVLEGSLGSYQMCFAGTVDAAKITAWSLLKADSEKVEPKILIDDVADVLFISYVDTKCLDDSLDATSNSCRAEWFVSRCM